MSPHVRHLVYSLPPEGAQLSLGRPCGRHRMSAARNLKLENVFTSYFLENVST